MSPKDASTDNCLICGLPVRKGLLYCPGLSECWLLAVRHGILETRGRMEKEEETQPSAYSKQALSTEQTPPFVTVDGGETHDLSLSRLFHAGMGLATETGEFWDQLKRHTMYGKPLDKTNIVEEVGDILWYCALALFACDADFDKAMRMNLNKLLIRYGGAFTSEKALKRNTEAERKMMEKMQQDDSLQGGKDND